MPAADTATALRSLADALTVMAGGKPQDGDSGEKGDQPQPGDGESEQQEQESESGESESENEGNPSESGTPKFGPPPASKPEALPEAVEAIIRDDTPHEAQPSGDNVRLIEVESDDYKIHPKAKAGDKILRAENIAAPQLNRGRADLERALISQGGIVSKLVTRLMRLIMAQQTRAWEFDKDDGALDPARLARVVSSPMLPIAYRQETEGKFKETTITLLLDNSGSMGQGNGSKTNVAAVCTDILVRAFERCGVPVEVLGFTAELKHYDSRYNRMSHLRHIIYKEPNVPYRRIRDNLAKMLWDIDLSQNVDGEALAWAYNRLIRRPQPRKILIVISDGCPSDGCSTNLSGHLRRIIAEIETRGEVELLAIGALHDVTAWYRHAIYVRDLPSLGLLMLEELTKLFTPKRGRAK